MEQITRQCVGIDIAKLSFTACVCKLSPNSGLCFSQVATFDNSTRGFNQLLKWARKQTTGALPS
ncbi:IS110 family transposase [Pontibacter korlensis]|uniref:IS110 family transposase n=1 Tax=Pontibacter korlensis TaxID=400092 RepID=UPI0011DCB279|nr:IS110 family transposase [Pontibacter korlensis]